MLTSHKSIESFRVIYHKRVRVFLLDVPANTEKPMKAGGRRCLEPLMKNEAPVFYMTFHTSLFKNQEVLFYDPIFL